MSLLSITIEGYRGIGAKQSLSLARPDSKTIGGGLTVLIGPNNSGKSTILRAISEIYSDGPDFVAEAEDRRGESFPSVEIQFESDGAKKTIKTEIVEKSAYLKKTGDVTAAAGKCRYIPARRPWRDRFSRNIGYSRDSYESDSERNRRSDDFYVDSQFGSMMYEVERDSKKKSHYLRILRYIEPTISDFWIDRAHNQDFLAFESASGFSHRAGLVGEGIQNIFRLSHALINQKLNELLLVDEPELSLHPQSQKRLYRLLARRAVDRQVLASTHSVHFIDWSHIRSGTLIYRANTSPKVGSYYSTLSPTTIKAITAIADLDVKNRRAFDSLAKELFFSTGCVLVEGYEDAHLLQKFASDTSDRPPEIFGYGSGGADGIIAWLQACSDLSIKAVGLFDADEKGSKAFGRAKKLFAGVPTIRLLQIPTPDIRDKPKANASPKVGSVLELEKEGMFTTDWMLKDKYKLAFNNLVKEMTNFLSTDEGPPSLAPA